MEGLSNCTKCHELGEDVKNDKCMDCHTEIKNQLTSKNGFHSTQNIPSKLCYECHSEHHGRNFKLIKFDKENFDHDKVGFKLSGRHSEINCVDCHKSEFRSDDKVDERPDSFLGLNQTCTSCHEDVHRKTLGNSCENCHNTKTFKPPSLFSHNKAKFKLTGAHQDVECQKCHKIEEIDGKKFQHFAGIKFNSCSNCHNDVHKGKFGSDCQSCHQTNSFTEINNKNRFDHSITNFPLLGKHNNVKCESCHKGKLTDKLVHNQCIDCHEDYHKKQFLTNATTTDCKTCHTVEGFKPSTFSIEDHDKLNFKLTGSHLALPCQACHLKNAEWKFRISGDRCIDCHVNFHENEISSKFMGENNCAGCHTTNAWKEVGFNHTNTGFELLGKHENTSCRDCHFDNSQLAVIQKFKSISSDCIVCHTDIHKGQFEKEGKTICQDCHIFDNWRPDNFDHSKTRFPLDGAHKKVECSKCHKSSDDDSYIVFKISGDIKCINCHS